MVRVTSSPAWRMKYSRMANSLAVSDTGTPPRRTWKRRRSSSRSPTRSTSETAGACIQPGDPVGDLAAGREDEHGHGALAAAQSPEQAQTVHTGEPDVEHDEVIGVHAQQVEGAFGARCTVDREAARGEPVAQCREEGAVVFDHEQSHRAAGTSSIAEPDCGRKRAPPGSLEGRHLHNVFMEAALAS